MKSIQTLSNSQKSLSKADFFDGKVAFLTMQCYIRAMVERNAPQETTLNTFKKLVRRGVGTYMIPSVHNGPDRVVEVTHRKERRPLFTNADVFTLEVKTSQAGAPNDYSVDRYELRGRRFHWAETEAFTYPATRTSDGAIRYILGSIGHDDIFHQAIPQPTDGQFRFANNILSALQERTDTHPQRDRRTVLTAT